MNIVKLFCLLALAWLMSGCITTAPTPAYALSGDLVQVGVGGIKRNASTRTLRFGDITATIRDSAGVTRNVKVQGLYRAYPDYTSQYARDVLDRNDAFFGEVEPYDGMWYVTLWLVNPSTNQPLPLAAGPATIAVSSAELTDTGWAQEGSLSNFPIEILEDAAVRTRMPTDPEQSQYTSYRAERAMTVSPDSLAGVSNVGGFQISLTYNSAAVVGILEPRLVPVSHDPNLSILQSTADNGDGTKTLVAMVTNPNGFVADSSPAADPNNPAVGEWGIGKSTFRDLEFALIFKDGTNLADGWQTNYQLDGADSFYIDVNGDVIAGVNPVLGRNF
jgi:hypothetical protein